MPETWVTVPVDPTAEMMEACFRMLDDWLRKKSDLRTQDLWREILAVAPPAPEHAALRLLQQLQWCHLDTNLVPGFCPVCLGHRDHGGHSHDCDLERLLKV